MTTVQTSSQGPVPAFDEYVPPAFVQALRSHSSTVAVAGVQGLQLVGGVHASEYADLLSPQALNFAVDLYRRSLTFRNGLQPALAHRKMKRHCLNRAAAALAERNQQSHAKIALQDVQLEDGTVALGYRPDTKSMRDDPSWKVAPIPASFARFHDTITAPPAALPIAKALGCGVHFLMVDFEDSSTVAQESLLAGLHACTLANRRQLVITTPKGKRYAITDEEERRKPMAEMLLRFEGLHLPNAHFLVDGFPMPAHIVTIALYLYHNWQPLQRIGKTPAFYIPKLETYEEAAYLAELFRTAEEQLASASKGAYAVGTLRCLAIVENVFAAYQKEEILFALRDYIVGLNCGWHDYMASIGAVHQNLPTFTMAPKSNLRIVVEHLEAYQMGVVDACKKRGAIPIGGMNGMVPPRGPHAKASWERIVPAFAQDFNVQVDRGLEGCWLAMPKLAPVIQKLIGEMEEKKLRQSPEQRRAEQARIADRIRQITHEKMLVSGLGYEVAKEEDCERNLSDAIQYLTSYLAGNGYVPITKTFPDGVPVTLMEDAATLERSRRELWSMLRYGKEVVLANGQNVPMSRELLDKLVKRVVQKAKANKLDVPFNVHTKIPLDVAVHIVYQLITSPQPADYFTVFATRYLLAPFKMDLMEVERLSNVDKFPYLRMDNLMKGAELLFISNESFAPASNLLKETYPIFVPHSFGTEGQIYDGWETVRHNMYPPDFVILKLTAPSFIHGVNIDTAHFDGNYAPGASVEGLVLVERNKRLLQKWVTLVPQSLLKGNSRNYFASIATTVPVVSVKLNNFPDGGIARLQLFGEKTDGKVADMSNAEWTHLVAHEWIGKLQPATGFPAGFAPPENSALDVAPPAPVTERQLREALPSSFAWGKGDGLVDAVSVDAPGGGGRVVASSSAHYSVPSNMLKVPRALNMGDGWETARMRGQPDYGVFHLEGPVLSDYNWTLFKLSQPCVLRKVGVDTLHFKHNNPIAFSLEGCNEPALTKDNYHSRAIRWTSLVRPKALQPHTEHPFDSESEGPVTHVLLKIYPCGGISRLRLYGKPHSSSAL